jgi:hypothetical protein
MTPVWQRPYEESLTKLTSISTEYRSPSPKVCSSVTHGAELFLRSHQLCSFSRTFQHFMEPEYLLPCSKEPSTGPYLEPDQSNPYNNFLSLRSFIQEIRPVPRRLVILRNNLIFLRFGVVSPRPTPKLENHPLSYVRECLFNIFAPTLQNWRESPPFATWGRAMSWWQGTHLTWNGSLILLLFVLSVVTKRSSLLLSNCWLRYLENIFIEALSRKRAWTTAYKLDNVWLHYSGS